MNNNDNKEGIIFAIVVLIIVTVLTFSCGSDSGSGSSSKYDYVTNSDGSRTWYDTTNDHIVRFD